MAQRVESVGLGRLVNDPAAFCEGGFGVEPRVTRGADPDAASLLGIDDVDRLVTASGLRRPGLRMARDGRPIDPAHYTRTVTAGGQRMTDVIDAGSVVRLFAEGASIVLDALHLASSPVAERCGRLTSELGHPVHANAYVTPASSRAFDTHYDVHDVFVLQTHGTKRWLVFGEEVEAALPGLVRSTGIDDPGEPTIDTVLEPGDCLYLPRGWGHRAASNDETSIHITFGVAVLTWADALERRLGELRGHAAFRRALPVGWTRDPQTLAEDIATRLDELAEWVRAADPAAIAESLAADFQGRRTPTLRGHLVASTQDREVDDATRVAPRSGTGAHVVAENGSVRLILGDRELELPGRSADAVRTLLSGETVRVGELPGLDPSERRALACTLVDEGALVVCTPAVDADLGRG